MVPHRPVSVRHSGCADDAPRANVTLPDDPDEVKVRVLNGTKEAGKADKVTNDFKNRGFVMEKPGG